jgi:hypothetical protein
MVDLYGDAVDYLVPVDDWMAVSRRGLELPNYRITRSSKYARDFTLCDCYTASGGSFITAFYGILSPDRRRFYYWSAGHTPPGSANKSGAVWIFVVVIRIG